MSVPLSRVGLPISCRACFIRVLSGRRHGVVLTIVGRFSVLWRRTGAYPGPDHRYGRVEFCDMMTPTEHHRIQAGSIRLVAWIGSSRLSLTGRNRARFL